MDNKYLLILAAAFINDSSLLQKFLDYCDEAGEDRNDIEYAIYELENEKR